MSSSLPIGNSIVVEFTVIDEVSEDPINDADDLTLTLMTQGGSGLFEELLEYVPDSDGVYRVIIPREVTSDLIADDLYTLLIVSEDLGIEATIQRPATRRELDSECCE